MSNSEVELVQLLISSAVLRPDGLLAAVLPGPDEIRDVQVDVPVVRLAAGRLRIAKPFSISGWISGIPFGSCGTSFGLGDVIAVQLLPDGRYRYVRTVEAGHVYTWTLFCPYLPKLDGEFPLDAGAR